MSETPRRSTGASPSTPGRPKTEEKRATVSFGVRCQECNAQLGGPKSPSASIVQSVPARHGHKRGENPDSYQKGALVSSNGRGGQATTGSALEASFVVLASDDSEAGKPVRPSQQSAHAALRKWGKRKSCPGRRHDTNSHADLRHSLQHKRELFKLAHGVFTEQPDSQVEVSMFKPLSVQPTSPVQAEPLKSVPEPICDDCLGEVLGIMQQQDEHLHEAQKNIGELVSETDKANAIIEQEGNAVFRELNSLLAEQAKVLASLQEAEKERDEQQNSERILQAEEEATAQREHLFWSDLGISASKYNVVAEKRDSLMQKVKTTMRSLKTLTSTHALNGTFYIWRDGDYGAINGFRLGQLLGSTLHYRKFSGGNSRPLRKNRPPPDWEEINMACGFCAMLLNVITQSCEFELSGYRIEPMGARTYIRKLSGGGNAAMNFLSSPGAYPLFLDMSKFESVLGRLNGLIESRSAVEQFNRGLRAFLVCMHQISQVAVQSKIGKLLNLKEKMCVVEIPDEQAWYRGLPANSARINDDSVDLTHNPLLIHQLDTLAPPEAEMDKAFRWTVAMRHVLTNLKWLLVWSAQTEKTQPF